MILAVSMLMLQSQNLV